jgi:hypothetical protein
MGDFRSGSSTMRNVTFWAIAVVVLLAAPPVRGADEGAPGGGKSAAEQAREKMEKMREKSRSAARPMTAKQKEAASDRVAAQRAKSVYMYAIEACERPARCDAALRDDAEKAFMSACQVCATADRCESERDAIKAGSAKRTESTCPAK